MNVSKNKCAFVGNMNNMPYLYSSEMRKKGVDITLYLDRPSSYLLDRPESIEPSFAESGLPSWIVEIKHQFRSQFISFSFPSIFYRRFIRKLNQYDVVFLNGNLISLGQFIKEGKTVVAIFSGADLDVAADFESRDYVVSAIARVAAKMLIPRFVINLLFPRWIRQQRKGIRRADVVSYFPSGMIPRADSLLNDIFKDKPFKRLELRGVDDHNYDYAPVEEGKNKFNILSFVRFHYVSNSVDNKRNDIMLRGIALFLATCNLEKPVEICLFKKGADLGDADQLCQELGLSPFIRWVEVVSMYHLKQFIRESDVVFDQLGNHQIGGGYYSMLMGRPLIANGRPEVFEPITGETSPVCQATTEEEVARWLTKLYNDPALVVEIGKQSRQYVLDHLSLGSTVEFFVDIVRTKQ